MGKFTVEKWQCDRCGIVADKRPYGTGRTHHEVRISADYETAGGKVISWMEMCAACDFEVGREINAMSASADAARKAITRTS